MNNLHEKSEAIVFKTDIDTLRKFGELKGMYELSNIDLLDYILHTYWVTTLLVLQGKTLYLFTDNERIHISLISEYIYKKKKSSKDTEFSFPTYYMPPLVAKSFESVQRISMLSSFSDVVASAIDLFWRISILQMKNPSGFFVSRQDRSETFQVADLGLDIDVNIKSRGKRVIFATNSDYVVRKD